MAKGVKEGGVERVHKGKMWFSLAFDNAGKYEVRNSDRMQSSYPAGGVLRCLTFLRFIRR